jgi:uncharacterized membrane protein
MFVLAGVIWLFILVPIQIRQARLANQWSEQAHLDDEYRSLSRRWITWGLISTIPLCAVLWLMVAKPL